MELDNKNIWYQALKSKDTKFDGQFFVGVASTGIYCRPVCRAKLSKVKNCTFYSTAAAAEQDGYRPCLLCRPELAPGNALVDASSSLAERATKILEENCGRGQTIEEVAHDLGCTDRHLRRVFSKEYNVSPVQYLQTCRLLLAKNLLTDTDISILDVAMASGFGSLRRFNDAFKKQYRLTPTNLRKQTNNTNTMGNTICLSLGYRPPYRWKEMLTFLSTYKIPRVELVEDDVYYRNVHLKTDTGELVQGWIKVKQHPKKNMLIVHVDSTLLSVIPQVLARVRHIFDLTCDPQAVHESLKQMDTIDSKIINLGTRLPGCFDPFEMAVRTILGEGNNREETNIVVGQFVERYGSSLYTVKGLTHTFPTPEDIKNFDETNSQYSKPFTIDKTKLNTILLLANIFIDKKIDFYHCVNPKEETEKLVSLLGISRQCALHIAMRTMLWTDVVIDKNFEIIKVLPSKVRTEVLNISKSLRPWRSYAIISLWNYIYQEEEK
ncbi:MAG: AlkA N-terminal domain-containing protein [Coprobacillaceae bacterium]